MNQEQKHWLGWLAVAAVIVLVSTFLGVKYPVPPPPMEEDVEAKAIERGALLCATESGNCVESWNGSDLIGYSDAGSSQTWHVDGATGDLDTEGDLDFGGDLEIGGVQTVDFNEFGASAITTDTTTHLVEVLDTTNVMTGGTNVLSAVNIDLGIGNSTGGTNSVYGILIDNISQDASNTETAIDIAGTGWDVGIGLGGNQFDLDADDDTSITADTDDQIDIEISGADDFRFTANTLTALSGSSIALASGAYPLGYASSGQQLVYGTASITGTATASHGLTTVTFCLCTMGEDPTSGAGDGAMCTTAVSANVCTLKVWQDDFVTAATETDVAIHWLVVGTP